MSVDIETAKQWLQRYGELQSNITELISRSEALRNKASSPGSPKMDGMPHNKRWQPSGMADIMALCIDIENEAKDKIKQSKLLYREIDDTIRKITGRGSADMRLVLRMKYLDLFEWDDINDVLWISKDDFLDKEDVYTRRTFRIHKNAICAISQFINLNEQ